MLETPHVIVGATIATKVANPWLSLPLSLASHFILEKLPHWNPHLNTEKEKHGKITVQSTKIVVADASLALISGLFIASRALPNSSQFIIILTASLLSILPDLVEAPYFFLNYSAPWVKRWIKFQKSLQVDSAPLPGLVTQLITVLASLWWLFT